MIGDTAVRERAQRRAPSPGQRRSGWNSPVSSPMMTTGLPAIEAVSLKVHAGEIVGVAGVSGNGQSELVEVISGQREPHDGRIFVRDEPFEPTRRQIGAPEGLRLARGAAAQRRQCRPCRWPKTIAFRAFDQPPIASPRLVAEARPAARQSPRADRALPRSSALHRKRLSPTCPAATSSARCSRASSPATSTCSIVANPCFGLDFASVAEIRCADHGAAQPRRRRAAGLRRISTRSWSWPDRGRRDVGRHASPMSP